MTTFQTHYLPVLTEENTFFWTSGADGVLRLQRCDDCGYWVHPAGPVCPKCLGDRLSPTAVSGRGEILTFSVCHQPWRAGIEVPYAVAIVGLPEQDGLRLTTQIVGVAPDEVEIGTSVEVEFVPVEDCWLPLFRPVAA